MKAKNPILNFRTASDCIVSRMDFKEPSIDKGFHEENVKLIMRDARLTATLITKTREAADMSESSHS